MKHAIVFGIILAWAMVTQANTELDKCFEKDDHAQQLECAGQYYQKADKALNVAYGSTMKKAKQQDQESRAMNSLTSPPIAVETIKKSQKAWIAYRDATCDAETLPVLGGSMARDLSIMCLIRLTEERTNWLLHLYIE